MRCYKNKNGGSPGNLLRVVLAALWGVLLASPAVTTFHFAAGSQVQPAWSLVTSVTLLLSAWLLLPPRLFLACSYPLALLALACAVTDLQRDVSLLELMAQWRTFAPEEVADALRPYASSLAVAGVALAVVAAVVWPPPGVRRSPALRAGAAVALAMAFFLAPDGDRGRAWPLNALIVTAAAITDMPELGASSTRAMDASPRRASSTWGARLDRPSAARQTFVFVIGESVRADYLKECGGPDKIRSVRDGAVVACDVTAGADVTSESVPLLISRESPGHGVRVSADGTFQHAFAEAGFSTYWFDMQADVVAWPDAASRIFRSGPDRSLLPLFDEALAKGSGRKSIVLHGLGAHSPYCQRFDPATAPYADACDRLDDAAPSARTIADWRAMYANAVDGSVGFVNDVIQRLEHVPGEAFLVYTPDHGENLLDDERALFGHALHQPTRWAIRVPAIFWANPAWRAAHPAEWRMLQANASQPLMHVDMVPTLLSAAGIRYDDRRRLPANLLAAPVPPRERLVQKSLGFTTDWDSLLHDAGAPSPL